jgi:hypothetical protein
MVRHAHHDESPELAVPPPRSWRWFDKLTMTNHREFAVPSPRSWRWFDTLTMTNHRELAVPPPRSWRWFDTLTMTNHQELAVPPPRSWRWFDKLSMTKRALAADAEDEEDDDESERRAEQPQDDQWHELDSFLREISVAFRVVGERHRLARCHPAADHAADQTDEQRGNRRQCRAANDVGRCGLRNHGADR